MLPPLNGRKACACSPNIRLYKYTVGQRFGKHVDVSSRLRDGSETQFTLLCYLNEVGLSGGETRFYPQRADEISVSPRAGMALFHRHGMDCWLHEVRARPDMSYHAPLDLARLRAAYAGGGRAGRRRGEFIALPDCAHGNDMWAVATPAAMAVYAGGYDHAHSTADAYPWLHLAAAGIRLADEDGNGVIDVDEFEKIFRVIAAMEKAAGKDKK